MVNRYLTIVDHQEPWRFLLSNLLVSMIINHYEPFLTMIDHHEPFVVS